MGAVDAGGRTLDRVAVEPPLIRHLPGEPGADALLDGFAAEHGGVRPTHTLAGFCE